MVDAVQQAIHELEAELSDVDGRLGRVKEDTARKRQLEQALVGLRALRSANADRPSPRRRPDTTPRRAGIATSNEDLVKARDQAITARLSKGPATRAELLEIMPKESGKTESQRIGDCGNALSRLRMKSIAELKDDRWQLVKR